jgi:hypothetical protein
MRTATLFTFLLASSVSARFIPAWFLNNPPSTVSIRHPGDSTIIRSIEELNVIWIIEEGLL